MKIGERGQVTIPKKIREKYGFTPNMEVSFVEEEGGVLIQKKGPHTNPVRQAYGMLGRKGSTDKFLEEIRGR
jgi:AbrB family looped-hinge helix DNA binding protein